MARNSKYPLLYMPELDTGERVDIPWVNKFQLKAQNSRGLLSIKPHQLIGAAALFRSSLGIPFKLGASVGAGDTPSIGMIPAWVSIAPPLMYLALVAGTSSNRKNNEKLMVKSIDFLAATYFVVPESKMFCEKEIGAAGREGKIPLKSP